MEDGTDMCTDGCLVVGADSFQNAQAIAPNINAGPKGAQVWCALMHRHRPATLRQRRRRRQTANPGASDFRPTTAPGLLHHRSIFLHCDRHFRT